VVGFMITLDLTLARTTAPATKTTKATATPTAEVVATPETPRHVRLLAAGTGSIAGCRIAG
jgi:hypothetical protein